MPAKAALLAMGPLETDAVRLPLLSLADEARTALDETLPTLGWSSSTATPARTPASPLEAALR